MNVRRFLFPAGLVAVVLLTGPLLAELCLRLLPNGAPLYLESAPRQVTPKVFLHLCVEDPDPRIVFRLRPKMSATFLDEPVETNSMGFRGPDVREDSRRIVGIGDSVMFGWGVADEETYLRRLERLLRRRNPDIDVVNTAVPAYNTVQEVATLERHLDRLKPALVIWGFIGNDYQAAEDPFARVGFLERHSYLYRLVSLRLVGMSLHFRSADHRDQSLEAMARLGRLSLDGGFPVICLFYSPLPKPERRPDDLPFPEIRSLCKRFGFQVVDTGQLLEEVGIPGLRAIWRSKTAPVDPHPSARGHAIMARGLARVAGRLLGQGVS